MILTCEYEKKQVEITMAFEEKFGVAIGEEGAHHIRLILVVRESLKMERVMAYSGFLIDG